jgi:hypothetical protein
MATLPDGGTVALQQTETFETIGDTTFSLWQSEGFESPIFIMGDFTVTVTATEIEAGGSTTVDGTATNTEGNAEPGAPYTVKSVLDGQTVAAKSGNADGNGDFSETLVLEDPGDHTVFAENDAVGKQDIDDFENIGYSPDSLRFTEDFENWT